ncbi:hypothetical protein TNCV_4447181 [Trichonephila clavipes]|nr:hypothetical protein TNCV_4447181 [Trichonephila clavipes]
MFSIGERSGEHSGQGNSRIFSVSRKVRTIPATCGCTLSCLNVEFRRRTQIKGRATGRNTTNVTYTVQSAVNANKRCPRRVSNSTPYHHLR